MSAIPLKVSAPSPVQRMNVKEHLTEPSLLRPARVRASNRRNAVVDVENPSSTKQKVGFGTVSVITPNNQRVLLERNGLSTRPRTVHVPGNESTLRDVRLAPFSTFSSASPGAFDETDTKRRFGTTNAEPSAVRYKPSMSPNVRSYSDSVLCDEINVVEVPSQAGLHSNETLQTSLAWDNNKPFTDIAHEMSLSEETGVRPDNDNSYPTATQEVLENDTAMSLSSSDSGDSPPQQNTEQTCGPKLTAGVRQVSPLDPVQEIRLSMKELADADAVFNVQLDFVLDKLVYALMDLNSAYLFRDFAGHLTEFLDRFGPGGYDSHRAPATPTWILDLLLPLIHADSDANEAHVRVYAEVSGWLQRMVGVLGWRIADVLLNKMGGAWERCVEHMSSSRLEISSVAFETAETILRNVPLEFNLVLKVVLMEPFNLALNDLELCRFRLYRAKLLSVLLERIDSACRAGEGEQYQRLVPEVVRALEKLKMDETDLRVSKSIDVCLKYAHDTEAMFSHKLPDQLSPRTRRPHLSLTFSKWHQLQLSEQQELKTQSKPKVGFFSRWFHRRSKGNGLNEASSVTPSSDAHEDVSIHDAVSVRTSKSTRTLRQRWQKLFGSSAQETESDGNDQGDVRTFITL